MAVRLYYAFWDTGKTEYAEAAVGPDFFDGTMPECGLKGPEGLTTACRACRRAVPDLKCNIEHLLVSDDEVVARSTFRGTYKEDYFGHPASGKPIEFRVVDILRVEGGRVIECRHIEDNYNSTLARRLGADPHAGQFQEKP
jgi:steroid delta-isomerase-like uncharacterized protein